MTARMAAIKAMVASAQNQPMSLKIICAVVHKGMRAQQVAATITRGTRV